jgi:phage terminase large subunit-like protein
MSTATQPRAQTHGSSKRKPDPGCQACGWKPEPGELWPSHGDIAVDWIERYCICGEGDWWGTLIKLRPDQQAFAWRWFEYCPCCEEWHYDEGLRGAATGDGKTQFIAALALVEFAGPDQIAVPSPNIPIGAASFEQANLLFTAVATMCGGRDQAVKESPLCGFFEVYDTEIKFADGRTGRIHRVAAVAGTNEGGLPSLFIADELHEWGEEGSRKARVHTVIGKSTKKRKTPRGAGRRLNLSTAGFDKDHSLLGAMYKLGKLAERDPSLAPRFLFDWHEAPEGLDYDVVRDREAAVTAASGAAGVLWSVRDRVNEWGKPGVQRHEWLRYYANRWVDMSEESWLADHPGAWDACKDTWKSADANPFVVVVDMALKHDSVAVSRIEHLSDGRYAITSKIWNPGNGQIDHLDVFKHVRSLAAGPAFRGVVYDPRFFELPGRMLEDEGILAIQFDQSPQRMAPACGLAFDLIIGGQIVHDGDPELAAHVKAAVKREQDRGFTLSKGKSKRHIDAAITLCMGVWVLNEVPEPPKPKPLFAWANN